MNTKQRIGIVAVLLAAMAVLTTCQQQPTPEVVATVTATTVAQTQAPSPTTTSQSSATPPPTDTPRATATAAPTQATTSTAAPSAAALPGLQTGGPYFAYWLTVDDQPVLVRVDADGRGRAALAFAADGPQPALYGGLSPTGEWVAAYSGGTTDCFPTEVPATAPDWSLQLVHVADGAVRTVTPLFGTDFMQKFDEAAAAFEPSDLGDTGIENVRLVLWQALICSLETLAWSPDGHTLAFAAALDGGSSDLYFYDLQTGAITRQSSGPEQIYSMSWSPDGAWLAYASTNAIGMGMEFNYHAVAFDWYANLSNVTNGTSIVVIDWVAPGIFLTHSAANGPGDFDLHTVNIATDEQRRLCPGSFLDYAVDYDLGLVAAGCGYGGDYVEPFGIYLFNLRTGGQVKVSDVPTGVHLWGIGDDRFALGEWDGSFHVQSLIAADGSVTPWQSGGLDFLSPDRHYRATVTSDAIDIYTAAGELVRSVSTDTVGPVQNVFWRPDEQGLFFRNDFQLYALDVAEGEPRLVEEELEFTDFSNPQWVGP